MGARGTEVSGGIPPDQQLVSINVFVCSQVCEEQKCQEEVFSLAANYLDRFLSVRTIKKTQLQLLGCACLLLSSKLREPRPLSAQLLVFYTDNSISTRDLWVPFFFLLKISSSAEFKFQPKHRL
uniref:Cyclin-like domain-containing protein n=1 Tax=Timema shepardi TaxID=629360 RepID=A0A7R9AMY3_TIMSH|nr:unnamed protein product [Timema shepardi]